MQVPRAAPYRGDATSQIEGPRCPPDLFVGAIESTHWWTTLEIGGILVFGYCLTMFDQTGSGDTATQFQLPTNQTLEVGVVVNH